MGAGEPPLGQSKSGESLSSIVATVPDQRPASGLSSQVTGGGRACQDS